MSAPNQGGACAEKADQNECFGAKSHSTMFLPPPRAQSIASSDQKQIDLSGVAYR
jgi:hypothetical protein